MGKAASPVAISLIAMAAFATLTAGSHAPRAAVPEPVQLLPGSGVAVAGSFIAAIEDETTSIVEAEPKCGYGTTLRGELIMETPRRLGFPFNATTFASPQGTFTTVTTMGGEGASVVDEVARVLNARADKYMKKLLRNCSL